LKDEVIMIQIERIRILNPRHRDKKKFELIVESIRNLGLKKPIQVSLRSTDEPEGPGYDLVCGQGRIEAFIALGHKEIPAIVVEVSREERLLRSLVENMARCLPAPMALINEIERLKELGYSNVEIGQKLDIPNTTVGGYVALKKDGEERLLEAVISGRICLGVAVDIARADTVEQQREFLKACESKQLNQASIRTVKRLIDKRRLIGKRRDPDSQQQKSRTSAESLVTTYRRESQRQKALVKKARVCEAKLIFIIQAFLKLVADDNFVTLLRAESLATMPEYLHEKLTTKRKEAA
jgi:ParB family transcriptional regulator, chromosome partitioning protein